MALDTFLLLDGVGVVFLIYVLANFWKEGRRYKNSSHSVMLLDEKHVGDRIAIIPSVYLYPKDQNSVIPFPTRYRQIHLSPEYHAGFDRTIEIRKRALPITRVRQSRS